MAKHGLLNEVKNDSIQNDQSLGDGFWARLPFQPKQDKW